VDLSPHETQLGATEVPLERASVAGDGRGLMPNATRNSSPVATRRRLDSGRVAFDGLVKAVGRRSRGLLEVAVAVRGGGDGGVAEVVFHVRRRRLGRSEVVKVAAQLGA
jgi:hypothetical protein